MDLTEFKIKSRRSGRLAGLKLHKREPTWPLLQTRSGRKIMRRDLFFLPLPFTQTLTDLSTLTGRFVHLPHSDARSHPGSSCSLYLHMRKKKTLQVLPAIITLSAALLRLPPSILCCSHTKKALNASSAATLKGSSAADGCRLATDYTAACGCIKGAMNAR